MLYLRYMPYSFASDNVSSTYPGIEQYIHENNGGQHSPYGEDEYCARAAILVRDAFALPEDAAVYFVPNGAMANILGCAAILGSDEGDNAIISPDDGHLAVHEKEAICDMGYHIISAATVIDESDKLSVDLLDQTLTTEDTPVPRALYLAQATDRGLAYTRDELGGLISYAKEKGVYSLIDGARLANAIASEQADFTLHDMGILQPDIFWIGGTKNGGEYGEAMVILNDELKGGFVDLMKRKGALMSKSWVMGAQFERFFCPEDDDDILWLKLARHANTQATTIYNGLLDLEGVSFHFEGGGTNILFPVLPDDVLARLQADYHFYLPARKIDGKRSRVRLVCSWDTASNIAADFVNAVRHYVHSSTSY